MKTVLCFGDSLTWGSNADTGSRHALEDRWPEVLRRGLGAGVEVITDGLRGRTTAYDEHLADCDRNGARILPTVLYTHAPIDLVIIMLGSNDLKPHIAGTALAAMQGMRRCVEIVRINAMRDGSSEPPDVLIVCPAAAVRDCGPGIFRHVRGRRRAGQDAGLVLCGPRRRAGLRLL